MANILHGITWGHSRGLVPLQAAAQRFSELNPGWEIHWKKRSLQEFADYPIETLAPDYDLLIIDHPWVGTAARTRCVLPLDEHLPEEVLEEQKQYSTGKSQESYFYQGNQWALALDAATPVASYRPDLIPKEELPRDWDDLLRLAKRKKLAIPAIPIDLLMNFYMFCIACGETPFLEPDQLVSEEKGVEALGLMQELYAYLPETMFSMNPIAIAEWMSDGKHAETYCPFSYGYSNYSRYGYARKLLAYTDLVSFRGEKLRSTLGGTGLAVSASSPNRKAALAFARQIVSEQWQTGIYTQNGGQPAHRKAWENEQTNAITNGYFRNTLPALDSAFVRPRYHGYLGFQDCAGELLWHLLRSGGNPATVLRKMNEYYRKSLEESSIMKPI